MLLEIRTKRVEPDITVLEFTGRITLGRESQRIETLVKDLLAQNEKKLLFDLAGVDYIDSSGLGIIACCFATVTQAGGGFRVAGANGKVQQLFRFTRLDTVFSIYPTVQEACQGFTVTQPAGA